ncbi:unnamed protein product [Tenebrio molitor]|nr:unnamed protein product [Tenebrio molitor]
MFFRSPSLFLNNEQIDLQVELKNKKSLGMKFKNN